MSAIEIIALVIVTVGLLELLVCLYDPQLLVNFARPIYNRPRLVQVVYLAGGAVVLYFLLASLTIVEVVACFLFAGFITGVAIAPMGPEIVEKLEQQVKRNRFWKDHGLAWAVWLGLIAWTLYAIFG